jgi:hypothetical protein
LALITVIYKQGLRLWCLTQLSTIFQLYRGYQAEELNDTDYEVESNDHEQLPVFLGRPSSPMKTHMVTSFTNKSNSIETYLS